MDSSLVQAYLYCALDIGKLLQESGAEISRVEDTVSRIMKEGAGVPRVEVFSITSNITATAYISGFETVTQMRRIRSVRTNMKRIEELNQLSRDIVSLHLEPKEIYRRIKIIRAEPAVNARLLPLGYAVISGAFACFFGGDLSDFAASALIGFLLCFLERGIGRLTDNLLMTARIWSVAGGFLAHLSVLAGLGHHADMISIGNIMLFIPGIAFTNSIRDMFIGDTLSGLVRMLESILLAVIIAMGFTLAGRLI